MDKNENIRALIVDDEERARDVLANLLGRCCPKVIIEGSYPDLRSGVEGIKEKEPDLVFLDVQMPEEQGLEIIKYFSNIEFEIIFVTAYSEFAINAFEASAIDYLVKPVNRKRLVEGVEKVEERIKEKATVEQFKALQEKGNDNGHSKIILPEKNQDHVVNKSDIVAIEASGAYSIVHLENSNKIIISKNLKHFTEVLRDDHYFFRLHKSWLVNCNYVENYSRSEAAVILNQGQIKAKVSKYKKKEFEALIPKV